MMKTEASTLKLQIQQIGRLWLLGESIYVAYLGGWRNIAVWLYSDVRLALHIFYAFLLSHTDF